MHSIILKIGNSHLVAAFFENEKMIDKLRLEYADHWEEILLSKIKEHPHVEAALLGSVNSKVEPSVKALLAKQKIPYIGSVSSSHLSVKLSVDHPEEVGADLIANAYGALKLFPGQDLIVVDIGTAVTFSVIKKSREFIGCVIMPGLEMGAYGLKVLTDKLPLADIKKPKQCLGKNSSDCISSGLYYGLLGAIEKIVFQLSEEIFPEQNKEGVAKLTIPLAREIGKDFADREESIAKLLTAETIDDERDAKDLSTCEARGIGSFATPSKVLIITGGVTTPSHESSGFIPKTNISKDLQNDLLLDQNRKIEPDLTLIGFAEILKEQLKNKQGALT